MDRKNNELNPPHAKPRVSKINSSSNFLAANGDSLSDEAALNDSEFIANLEPVSLLDVAREYSDYDEDQLFMPDQASVTFPHYLHGTSSQLSQSASANTTETLSEQTGNKHVYSVSITEGSYTPKVNNYVGSSGRNVHYDLPVNISSTGVKVEQSSSDATNILKRNVNMTESPPLVDFGLPVPHQQYFNNRASAVSVPEHIVNVPRNNEEVSNRCTHNWQASKSSVKERLSFLYNSEVLADIHFVVGKPPLAQRIPAHKFVLSASSAVFDALFNGGITLNSDEVEIPDIEAQAFLALLRFLYCDEVCITADIVMATLYAAKKYAIPALEKACVDFLKHSLNSDNAFTLLGQARLFDEPQLAALCLDTIDRNASEAFASEGFLDIDLETLCSVIRRASLGVREIKLFHAICRWAESECRRRQLAVSPENQRAVLGPALDLVRFPLMTLEDFANGPAQSAILTDREIVDLFLFFTINPKPTLRFIDTPRCCVVGREFTVSRFCQTEHRWGYSGTSDRIRFVVNRRIYVIGLGLYGSIHGPAEYLVNIQIIHTDSGRVCGSSDVKMQSDGTNNVFRVLFRESVELQPNTNYTAAATLSGPDSYYGSKGLRKVAIDSASSGKVSFQFSYAAGSNNGTSVEDGQIPDIIFHL